MFSEWSGNGEKPREEGEMRWEEDGMASDGDNIRLDARDVAKRLLKGRMMLLGRCFLTICCRAESLFCSIDGRDITIGSTLLRLSLFLMAILVSELMSTTVVTLAGSCAPRTLFWKTILIFGIFCPLLSDSGSGTELSAECMSTLTRFLLSASEKINV